MGLAIPTSLTWIRFIITLSGQSGTLVFGRRVRFRVVGLLEKAPQDGHVGLKGVFDLQGVVVRVW